MPSVRHRSHCGVPPEHRALREWQFWHAWRARRRGIERRGSEEAVAPVVGFAFVDRTAIEFSPDSAPSAPLCCPLVSALTTMAASSNEQGKPRRSQLEQILRRPSQRTLRARQVTHVCDTFLLERSTADVVLLVEGAVVVVVVVVVAAGAVDVVVPAGTAAGADTAAASPAVAAAAVVGVSIHEHESASMLRRRRKKEKKQKRKEKEKKKSGSRRRQSER